MHSFFLFFFFFKRKRKSLTEILGEEILIDEIHHQSLKPRREVANTGSSAVLPEDFGKDFMTAPAKSVLDDLDGG